MGATVGALVGMLVSGVVLVGVLLPPPPPQAVSNKAAAIASVKGVREKPIKSDDL